MQDRHIAIIGRLGLLVEKVNEAAETTARIREAFLFSKNAHGAQVRKSGRPYITHPTEVALLLRSKGCDLDTIVAGFLHDIPGNCAISLVELTERFGEEIGRIIGGLVSYQRIELGSKTATDIPSIFKNAFYQDMRIASIALCDHLVNLRDMYVLNQNVRQRIIAETTRIHLPLAQILGLHEISSEMAELVYFYSYDYEFQSDIMRKYIKSREIILDNFDSPIITNINELYPQIYRVEKALPPNTKEYPSSNQLKDTEVRLAQINNTLLSLEAPRFENILGSWGPIDLKGVYKWCHYLLNFSRRAKIAQDAVMDIDQPNEAAWRWLCDLDKKHGGIHDALYALALRARDF